MKKEMLKVLKGLATNIVCAVSGMAMVVGESEDAPGLILIGMVLIGISMYFNYKLLKK